ncbi:hypothetical protein SCB29_38680, partial [Paraburkholderia sp. SIMBA_055]
TQLPAKAKVQLRFPRSGTRQPTRIRTHADLRANPMLNDHPEETAGGRIGYDANDAVLNE